MLGSCFTSKQKPPRLPWGSLTISFAFALDHRPRGSNKEQAKEKEKLVSRTYPVADLIGPNEDYGSLIRMLETSTSGPWMARDGEGGNMTELVTTGSLVVRQTASVQRQVLGLLRQQREAQQRMLPMKPGKPLPSRR